MTVKIAVISDLHFGFGRGTERSGDCWEAAEEAFSKAKNCDLIVVPGDIFDEKIPRPEDWAKALKIFSRIKVPVVAIHGTHERRGRGLINCVQGLEHASFLKHLHCSSATYDINGKKVTVHGMSGVPESYAKEVLEQWDPKPGEGFNIFMLHQSIQPYIYNPVEPPSLKLEDLPKGFDLYVSGHIHWREKTEIMGKPFIIPGSLVTTQVNKTEMKYPKGFYVVEIGHMGGTDIKFVELEEQRKVYYRDFVVDDKVPDVTEKIDLYLAGIKEKKKPLVRVRVTGRVGKGEDPDFSRLRDKYREKMILSVASRISGEELENKLKLLEDIRESRISVDEMGLRILRDNLRELGIGRKYEDVFDLLVEGDVDGAMVNVLAESGKEEEEKKEKPAEEAGEEEPVKELDKDRFEKELFSEDKEKKPARKNLFDWSQDK
ncbi:MAG: DNA repair exonuclease [archaeon]|nr:MAG: DNA repair exonuclease [archaeon]